MLGGNTSGPQGKGRRLVCLDVDGNDTMDIIADGFYSNAIVWYKNNDPDWTKNYIDESITFIPISVKNKDGLACFVSGYIKNIVINHCDMKNY